MEAERVVEGRAHPGSRQGRLRRQESAENFPVALRVLPAAIRGHLRAVYDVVRVIDNLGDDPGTPADRLAALAAFGADLATVWTTGRPRDPVLVALVPSVRAVGLRQRDLCRARSRPTGRTSGVTRYADARRPPRLLRAVGQPGRPAGAAGLRGRHAGAGGAVRPGVHRAAAASSTCRTSARTRAAGSTCRPRTSTASACAEDDLAAPRGVARVRPAGARSRPAGPARCSTAGRRWSARCAGWARLAVAGFVAGGLAALDAHRRRRRRRARSVHAAPRRGRHRAARVARAGRAAMTETGRCRHERRATPTTPCAAITTTRGQELLLRHPAAARRQAPTRCRPSTPWPGGSTTSATATTPVGSKLEELAGVREALGRDRADRPTTRCWSRCRRRGPPATDSRWTRSAS